MPQTTFPTIPHLSKSEQWFSLYRQKAPLRCARARACAQYHVLRTTFPTIPHLYRSDQWFSLYRPEPPLRCARARACAQYHVLQTTFPTIPHLSRSDQWFSQCTHFHILMRTPSSRPCVRMRVPTKFCVSEQMSHFRFPFQRYHLCFNRTSGSACIQNAHNFEGAVRAHARSGAISCRQKGTNSPRDLSNDTIPIKIGPKLRPLRVPQDSCRRKKNK